MDYESALMLKKSISEEIIRPLQNKVARIFSVTSTGTPVRSIRLSRELRLGVNGVGITEMKNKKGYQLKILTRDDTYSAKAVATYYNLSPEQISVRRAGRSGFTGR